MTNEDDRDLEPYLLLCEVAVKTQDEESGATERFRPCGQPAVNGFLCVDHSRSARALDAEEPLMMVYGCAPCHKVIARGFDRDGKEYRLVHFNADETQMPEELRKQYERYLDMADMKGIDIASGPFVLWQSAFEVEEVEVEEVEEGDA